MATFKIEKIESTEADGRAYYRARCTMGDVEIIFHNRHGSWLTDDGDEGHYLEAKPVIAAELEVELQRLGRQQRRAIRRKERA